MRALRISLQAHPSECGQRDARGLSVAEVVPNEELRALLSRLYTIAEARDGDGLADLFSREPSLMIMSPDPEGRLTGTDAVNVFAEQMRFVPRWSWTPRDPRAFSCGNVGWVTDDPTIVLGDLPAFRARLTRV